MLLAIQAATPAAGRKALAPPAALPHWMPGACRIWPGLLVRAVEGIDALPIAWIVLLWLVLPLMPGSALSHMSGFGMLEVPTCAQLTVMNTSVLGVRS